ncbi:hypothetical protein C922_00259 [Plasmodium inui San Antonio 1]|uniref:Mon2/Sec7/BIG1-like dimerisation and cyclophilin-binding domain-containing protein n=1 Tax=Plasmodium inui San Antonio 1 TaxID=1237626 RepID=W7AVE4_9APIC|nr:hypothetical protein C922_00259 [Plasmodium inui San Antonio 1]EUD69396.1 hypothetical protein C922_00259 [Plasmodium inui San Antonio 1]
MDPLPLLEELENDMKVLISETRKKNVCIKEKTEICIIKIKNYNSIIESNKNQLFSSFEFPIDEILDIVNIGINISSHKISNTCLLIIKRVVYYILYIIDNKHKIRNFRYINIEKQIEKITNKLFDLTFLEDKRVLIKIVQIILAPFSHQYMEYYNKDIINTLLKILYSVYYSSLYDRNTILYQTCCVAYKQLLNSLIDVCNRESRGGVTPRDNLENCMCETHEKEKNDTEGKRDSGNNNHVYGAEDHSREVKHLYFENFHLPYDTDSPIDLIYITDLKNDSFMKNKNKLLSLIHYLCYCCFVNIRLKYNSVGVSSPCAYGTAADEKRKEEFINGTANISQEPRQDSNVSQTNESSSKPQFGRSNDQKWADQAPKNGSNGTRQEEPTDDKIDTPLKQTRYSKDTLQSDRNSTDRPVEEKHNTQEEEEQEQQKRKKSSIDGSLYMYSVKNSNIKKFLKILKSTNGKNQMNNKMNHDDNENAQPDSCHQRTEILSTYNKNNLILPLNFCLDLLYIFLNNYEHFLKNFDFFKLLKFEIIYIIVVSLKYNLHIDVFYRCLKIFELICHRYFQYFLGEIKFLFLILIQHLCLTQPFSKLLIVLNFFFYLFDDTRTVFHLYKYFCHGGGTEKEGRAAEEEDVEKDQQVPKDVVTSGTEGAKKKKKKKKKTKRRYIQEDDHPPELAQNVPTEKSPNQKRPNIVSSKSDGESKGTKLGEPNSLETNPKLSDVMGTKSSSGQGEHHTDEDGFLFIKVVEYISKIIHELLFLHSIDLTKMYAHLKVFKYDRIYTGEKKVEQHVEQGPSKSGASASCERKGAEGHHQESDKERHEESNKISDKECDKERNIERHKGNHEKKLKQGNGHIKPKQQNQAEGNHAKEVQGRSNEMPFRNFLSYPLILPNSSENPRENFYLFKYSAEKKVSRTLFDDFCYKDADEIRLLASTVDSILSLVNSFYVIFLNILRTSLNQYCFATIDLNDESGFALSEPSACGSRSEGKHVKKEEVEQLCKERGYVLQSAPTEQPPSVISGKNPSFDDELKRRLNCYNENKAEGTNKCEARGSHLDSAVIGGVSGSLYSSANSCNSLIHRAKPTKDRSKKEEKNPHRSKPMNSNDQYHESISLFFNVFNSTCRYFVSSLCLIFSYTNTLDVCFFSGFQKIIFISTHLKINICTNACLQTLTKCSSIFTLENSPFFLKILRNFERQENRSENNSGVRKNKGTIKRISNLFILYSSNESKTSNRKGSEASVNDGGNFVHTGQSLGTAAYVHNTSKYVKHGSNDLTEAKEGSNRSHDEVEPTNVKEYFEKEDKIDDMLIKQKSEANIANGRNLQKREQSDDYSGNYFYNLNSGESDRRENTNNSRNENQPNMSVETWKNSPQNDAHCNVTSTALHDGEGAGTDKRNSRRRDTDHLLENKSISKKTSIESVDSNFVCFKSTLNEDRIKYFDEIISIILKESYFINNDLNNVKYILSIKAVISIFFIYGDNLHFDDWLRMINLFVEVNYIYKYISSIENKTIEFLNFLHHINKNEEDFIFSLSKRLIDSDKNTYVQNVNSKSAEFCYFILRFIQKNPVLCAEITVIYSSFSYFFKNTIFYKLSTLVNILNSIHFMIFNQFFKQRKMGPKRGEIPPRLCYKGRAPGGGHIPGKESKQNRDSHGSGRGSNDTCTTVLNGHMGSSQKEANCEDGNESITGLTEPSREEALHSGNSRGREKNEEDTTSSSREYIKFNKLNRKKNIIEKYIEFLHKNDNIFEVYYYYLSHFDPMYTTYFSFYTDMFFLAKGEKRKGVMHKEMAKDRPNNSECANLPRQGVPTEETNLSTEMNDKPSGNAAKEHNYYIVLKKLEKFCIFEDFYPLYMIEMLCVINLDKIRSIYNNCCMNILLLSLCKNNDIQKKSIDTLFNIIKESVVHYKHNFEIQFLLFKPFFLFIVNPHACYRSYFISSFLNFVRKNASFFNKDMWLFIIFLLYVSFQKELKKKSLKNDKGDEEDSQKIMEENISNINSIFNILEIIIVDYIEEVPVCKIMEVVIQMLILFSSLNVLSNNVSFRAINFSWSVVDYIVGRSHMLKRNGKEKDRGAAEEGEKGTSQGDEHKTGQNKLLHICVIENKKIYIYETEIKMKNIKMKSFFIFILNQLMKLCFDERIEVRNCSIKTIISILSTHICKFDFFFYKTSICLLLKRLSVRYYSKLQEYFEMECRSEHQVECQSGEPTSVNGTEDVSSFPLESANSDAARTSEDLPERGRTSLREKFRKSFADLTAEMEGQFEKKKRKKMGGEMKEHPNLLSEIEKGAGIPSSNGSGARSGIGGPSGIRNRSGNRISSGNTSLGPETNGDLYDYVNENFSKIIIHHSRDSKLKQWIESFILIIEGCNRILLEQRNYRKFYIFYGTFVNILKTTLFVKYKSRNMFELHISILQILHNIFMSKFTYYDVFHFTMKNSLSNRNRCSDHVSIFDMCLFYIYNYAYCTDDQKIKDFILKLLMENLKNVYCDKWIYVHSLMYLHLFHLLFTSSVEVVLSPGEGKNYSFLNYDSILNELFFDYFVSGRETIIHHVESDINAASNKTENNPPKCALKDGPQGGGGGAPKRPSFLNSHFTFEYKTNEALNDPLNIYNILENNKGIYSTESFGENEKLRSKNIYAGFLNGHVNSEIFTIMMDIFQTLEYDKINLLINEELLKCVKYLLLSLSENEEKKSILSKLLHFFFDEKILFNENSDEIIEKIELNDTYNKLDMDINTKELNEENKECSRLFTLNYKKIYPLNNYIEYFQIFSIGLFNYFTPFLVFYIHNKFNLFPNYNVNIIFSIILCNFMRQEFYSIFYQKENYSLVLSFVNMFPYIIAGHVKCFLHNISNNSCFVFYESIIILLKITYNMLQISGNIAKGDLLKYWCAVIFSVEKILFVSCSNDKIDMLDIMLIKFIRNHYLVENSKAPLFIKIYLTKVISELNDKKRRAFSSWTLQILFEEYEKMTKENYNDSYYRTFMTLVMLKKCVLTLRSFSSENNENADEVLFILYEMKKLKCYYSYIDMKSSSILKCSEDKAHLFICYPYLLDCLNTENT